MSATNAKTAGMFVAAAAVLLGAMMVPNPISVANAQENQTNATKIDVDPIIKSLQNAYPNLEFGEDDQKFVDGLKDIKDPKELARLMIAEQLIHDLNALKGLQD